MSESQTPIRFAPTLAAAPKIFKFTFPKTGTPTATAPPGDEASAQILEAIATREAAALATREAAALATREALTAERVAQNHMTVLRQAFAEKRESETEQNLHTKQDQRTRLAEEAALVEQLQVRDRLRREVPVRQ